MQKTNSKKRIMAVLGTRPDAIKLCPLIKELRGRECFSVSVCVTAQHRELLDQVLDYYKLSADFDLNIMQDEQPLTDLTCRVLKGMEGILSAQKPELVIVHGDTTTAFAASLAAFYVRIPVAHVEAGLRTRDLSSPFPEEFNRQAADIIAKYRFAPTQAAADNLIAEGKDPAGIYVTGNTVIDALAANLKEGYTHPVLEEAAGRRLVLISAHRRENIGAPMQGMFRAIKRVVAEHPDVFAVFTLHMNPAARDCAISELNGVDRIKLMEPLPVSDFQNLMARCFMILTDSGGVQEEAQYLGKPVLVMRSASERPEGIENGCLRLVGTSEEAVYWDFSLLLDDETAYRALAKPSDIYGDGRASEMIADILEKLL